MKYLVWCLVGLLLILHQDYWQWNKADLVFGFLPYSLVYHIGISLGAAAVWILAVKYCWPRRVDEFERDLADGDSKS